MMQRKPAGLHHAANRDRQYSLGVYKDVVSRVGQRAPRRLAETSILEPGPDERVRIQLELHEPRPSNASSKSSGSGSSRFSGTTILPLSQPNLRGVAVPS